MIERKNTNASASEVIAEFIRSASRDAGLRPKGRSLRSRICGVERTQQIDRIIREALASNEDLHELNHDR